MVLYKQVGAEIHLLKKIEGRLVMDASKVLSATDTDRLMNAFEKIDHIRSRLEDNMFHDFPELSNDYLNVFYGDFEGNSVSDVSKEMKQKAKEMADELIR